MGHQGVVEGGLRVGALVRLPSLLLLGSGACRGLLLVVLEARVEPLLGDGVAQDGRHAQLHLEVQEVVPAVFEEEILERQQ